MKSGTVMSHQLHYLIFFSCRHREVKNNEPVCLSPYPWAHWITSTFFLKQIYFLPASFPTKTRLWWIPDFTAYLSKWYTCEGSSTRWILAGQGSRGRYQARNKSLCVTADCEWAFSSSEPLLWQVMINYTLCWHLHRVIYGSLIELKRRLVAQQGIVQYVSTRLEPQPKNKKGGGKR